MNKATQAILLSVSWLCAAAFTGHSWDTIAQIDIEEFDPAVWFTMLFALNWIGINLILTVFFFRGLPGFVAEREEHQAG